MNINKMELRELTDLLNATTLICQNYENSLKRYDGSINTSISEYNDFTYFNNIRFAIIKEIEERLRKIKL